MLLLRSLSDARDLSGDKNLGFEYKVEPSLSCLI